MQYSYLQKQQIVKDLQAIKGLNSVVAIEGVKDLLTMVWPNGLPGAVMGSPNAKKATKVDSQHNDRVYEFTIYVVVDAKSVSNYWDVEQLNDTIMNALDADQTLDGLSAPTIDAVANETVTLESADKTLYVTPIVVAAHTLIDVPLIT